jgi:hypothetical protein
MLYNNTKRKKLDKCSEFFLTVHFHDFLKVSGQKMTAVIIRNNLTVPTTMSS